MRVLPPLLLLVASLVPRPALASVVRDQSIEDMAVAADAVVLGEVVARRTVPVDRGRRLVTLVTVRVDEALVGDPGPTVEVQMPGGTLGDITQKVVGLQLPEPGDDLALFLSRRPGRAGRYRLPGLGRSLYHLREGRAVRPAEGLEVVTGPLDGRPDGGTEPGVRAAAPEGLPVAELRRRVREARAGARDGGDR